MKLATEPDEDAQAQVIDAVTTHTQTFNKVGSTETEERDETCMVPRGTLGVLSDDTFQKGTLMGKPEQLRDFWKGRHTELHKIQ